MRYIDLFVRDHPEMDPRKAVLENCPHDFGYDGAKGAPCVITPGWQDCRGCWERDAEEEDSPSSAPSGHLPPMGEGRSFEEAAEQAADPDEVPKLDRRAESLRKER